jgi:phosphoribosylglycinamide formyltransferase 1
MTAPKNFRVAFLVSGGGTTAEAIIKECRSNGRLSRIMPVCVIASKPGISAIERLHRAGIDEKDIVIVEPKKFANEEEFGNAILKELESRKVNLVGQFGWMAKTPKNVIEVFRGYIINQHPGPLDIGRPDFGGKGMYGRRVHATRINFVRRTNHDFWTEAISQRVAEEFDAGKVLKQKRVPILPDDSPESLQARLLPVEHETQIETLEDFMNDQVKELERSEPLIKKEELEILEEAKQDAIKQYPQG